MRFVAFASAALIALGIAVFGFFAMVAGGLCDTGSGCPPDSEQMASKVMFWLGAAAFVAIVVSAVVSALRRR